MQSGVDEKGLHLYLQGLEDYDNISAQIAMDAADVTEISDRVDIHTIILLDNSLSVTEPNQEKIRTIVEDYVTQKEASEQISIATFGEDVVYLAERENDSEVLLQALDGIEHQNQDSFLTDILYDEILKLQDSGEYTRFLVATDGADDKAIGYTLSELKDLLKEKNYPVYALGCTYKDNSKELENLFSISRLTQAEYFLLDDYEEDTEILQALAEKVTGVSVKIPEECCDGSDKSILLSIETAGEVKELTTTAKMPFQLKEQEPEPVVEPEPELEPEPVVEPVPVEPEPEPEPVVEEPSIDFVTIGAAVAIVIMLILFVVYQVLSKKKKKEPKPEEPKEEEPLDMTAMMPVEEEATVFLGGSNDNYIVILRDKKDASKIFRYPLRDKVIIGRKNEDGVNIVLNYDASISGKHCEITVSGDHFYIEDLHSANKTYLNGQLVEGCVEFQSGSTLRLGRVEMILEVVKAR